MNVTFHLPLDQPGKPPMVGDPVMSSEGMTGPGDPPREVGKILTVELEVVNEVRMWKCTAAVTDEVYKTVLRALAPKPVSISGVVKPKKRLYVPPRFQRRKG